MINMVFWYILLVWCAFLNYTPYLPMLLVVRALLMFDIENYGTWCLGVELDFSFELDFSLFDTNLLPSLYSTYIGHECHILQASCTSWFLKDFSLFDIYISPTETFSLVLACEKMTLVSAMYLDWDLSYDFSFHNVLRFKCLWNKNPCQSNKLKGSLHE